MADTKISEIHTLLPIRVKWKDETMEQFFFIDFVDGTAFRGDGVKVSGELADQLKVFIDEQRQVMLNVPEDLINQARETAQGLGGKNWQD